MAIPLGMPASAPPVEAPAAPPWRTAWDAALYGPHGYFRHRAASSAAPGVDVDVLAPALLRLVRHHGLLGVSQVGAGDGQLLVALHRLAPDLAVLGIDPTGRPEGLPEAVSWSTTPPEQLDGLVVAVGWLSRIPCHVVEVDRAGDARIVHVDPTTGTEALGKPVSAATVPASLTEWLQRWWPLGRRPPGSRAEVGTTRDRAWADVVGRVGNGLAVAVDAGHLVTERPMGGSLAGSLAGRSTGPRLDGSEAVTARVAVDAVAEAVGGTALRQADALRSPSVTARPPVELAATDPLGYLRALRLASVGAAPSGADGVWWVLSSPPT